MRIVEPIEDRIEQENTRAQKERDSALTGFANIIIVISSIILVTGAQGSSMNPVAATLCIIGFVFALLSCKMALSITGVSAGVLDLMPRGFAKSALATLIVSVALTILFW